MGEIVIKLAALSTEKPRKGMYYEGVRLLYLALSVIGEGQNKHIEKMLEVFGKLPTNEEVDIMEKVGIVDEIDELHQIQLLQRRNLYITRESEALRKEK